MASNNKKKSHCYGCPDGFPLTEEHVIPQAIGGKLKVHLCDKCQKKTYEIDSDLTNRLQHLSTLFDVKRNRKENKPFEVTQVKSGEKFKIDSHTGKRIRPKVNIYFDKNGAPIPDVRARSKNELNDILRGIKNKYGELSPNTQITIEPYSLGCVEHDHTIGGRLFMRSIAKTSYLFMASHLPKDVIFSEIFDPIRKFIFNNHDQSLVSFNFINTKFMDDNKRPLHCLAVHFDSKKRNIIGYVQYFGMFRFSILLSGEFLWKVVLPALKYSFDPVTSTEIPLVKNFTLPDIIVKNCLAPVQTKELVYREIVKAIKRIETYCNGIKEIDVNFSG